MVGQNKPQVSLPDSAFSKRKKRSRSDSLLQKIDKYVHWQELENICRPVYKSSRRGRPGIPVQFSLKCLILQYLYNLSDPALIVSLNFCKKREGLFHFGFWNVTEQQNMSRR